MSASRNSALTPRRRACLPVALASLVASLLPGCPARAETHANLQAVKPDGTSAWTGALPFTLTGVLLCDPDEMLDATPDFQPWEGGANQFRIGGEWQIVFQTVEATDRGGTTCWLGQNYGNMPWLHNGDLSYPNPAWTAEVLRLSFDPATLHRFRAGDLVEVTARQSLFYGGKRNINEAHDIDPAANFDIALVQAGYGLPSPEVITLTDFMRPDDGNPATHEDIFDATRATGGEHWQGMRVRLNHLTLVTTNGWNPANAWNDRTCTVTDGAGRFATLRLPRASLGAAPAGAFDAVGIFTQESGSGSDGTFGYELFVQQVLPHAPVPSLDITLQTVIRWPVSADVYRLESRTDAATGTWTGVTNLPTVVDEQVAVILPPSGTQAYFQLRKAN